MGVKDRNFPKQIGSTVMTAGAGLAATQGFTFGAQAA